MQSSSGWFSLVAPSELSFFSIILVSWIKTVPKWIFPFQLTTLKRRKTFNVLVTLSTTYWIFWYWWFGDQSVDKFFSPLMLNVAGFINYVNCFLFSCDFVSKIWKKKLVWFYISFSLGMLSTFEISILLSCICL